jgi:hypothetical protein
MTFTWTRTAAALLLPFPDEAWTIDLAGAKKGARAIVEATGELPAMPTIESETARGLALRLDQRYGENGNHPRDTFGRDLVDLWCGRLGLEHTTRILVAIVRAPNPNPSGRRSYEIRRDGQPWRRLREHVATADLETRGRAKAVAAEAWADIVRDPDSTPLGIASLRAGLVYAFCDDAWTTEMLPSAIATGYGQLAVLAALRDAEQLARTIEALFEKPIYQLVEELPPHAPNVMRTLGADRPELVIRIARRAATKKLQKPWLDLLACYTAPEARQYLVEVGG